MANNQYTNKVVFNGTTLMDVSGTTVAADKLLQGYTAVGPDGSLIQGSLQQQSIDFSGVNVTADKMLKGTYALDSSGNLIEGSIDVDEILSAINDLKKQTTALINSNKHGGNQIVIENTTGSTVVANVIFSLSNSAANARASIPVRLLLLHNSNSASNNNSTTRYRVKYAYSASPESTSYGYTMSEVGGGSVNYKYWPDLLDGVPVDIDCRDVFVVLPANCAVRILYSSTVCGGKVTPEARAYNNPVANPSSFSTLNLTYSGVTDYGGYVRWAKIT